MKRILSLPRALFRGLRRLPLWFSSLPRALFISFPGALFRGMRRMPLWFSILLMVVVLGGLSFGGYKGASSYSYMQKDPQFCLSCHVMETAWDRWQTSEHREVNCHACHEIGPVQGARLIIGYLLTRPERIAKHASVPDEACAKCHESNDPQWLQVADTAGHRVHVEGQNIACTKCHSVSIHRFTPPSTICGLCHEDKVNGEKQIKVDQMSQLHCLACHQYLRQETPGTNLLPIRESCLSCHLQHPAPNITWPAQAPMQFLCEECHRPHEQAQPVVVCLACHGEVAVAGLHAKGAHQGSPCQACHRPHEWEVKARENCLACHGDKANHYAGVLCFQCHDFKQAVRAAP